MDARQFDQLTRNFGAGSTRRRLLTGLATLLPVSGLAGLFADAAEARRRHGRNRGHHPGKHKRNRKGKRKGGKGGDLGGPTCQADGAACTESSACCSQNCFNFVCADPIRFCDNSECQPLAAGCCAVEACCQPPANQCNFAGDCCAPNCTGRQCGPDGCGNSGTCGSCGVGQLCNEDGKCVCDAQSCPSGTACDEASGQCHCTPQSCPNGCCSNGPGKPGTCEAGNTNQSCNRNGAQCVACASGSTCGEAGCQVDDCSTRCNAPGFCLNLIDGTTVCDSGEQESVCVVNNPAASICTSAADCNDGFFTLCVVSYADATLNQTVFNTCGGQLGALCTYSQSQ